MTRRPPPAGRYRPRRGQSARRRYAAPAALVAVLILSGAGLLRMMRSPEAPPQEPPAETRAPQTPRPPLFPGYDDDDFRYPTAAAGGVLLHRMFECAVPHTVGVRALGGDAAPESPARFRIDFGSATGRHDNGFFMFELEHVAGKTVNIFVRNGRAQRTWTTDLFSHKPPVVQMRGRQAPLYSYTRSAA